MLDLVSYIYYFVPNFWLLDAAWLLCLLSHLALKRVLAK